MISYFRSGPGERRRFRSDTRYATHTSDYGRRRWSSCGRPRPSSGTLHPYPPRHTSFIMTVIIDYAPTSNPFSSPPSPPSSALLRPTLSFFAALRRCRPRPRSIVLVVAVVVVLLLLVVLARLSALRASKRNREQHIIATRGYTKWIMPKGGRTQWNVSPPLSLPFFFSPDEGVCGDPLRIFESRYRDSSFSRRLDACFMDHKDSVSRLRWT